jgi:glycine/serine hydroxymethyltransferase
MVPFDDKSPFVTSGIRVGTAAIYHLLKKIWKLL